jgi:hypothetical protein
MSCQKPLFRQKLTRYKDSAEGSMLEDEASFVTVERRARRTRTAGSASNLPNEGIDLPILICPRGIEQRICLLGCKINDATGSLFQFSNDFCPSS